MDGSWQHYDVLDGTTYTGRNGTYGDSWKDTNDAIFGGGTLGYNFQTGAFVFGVETDFGVVGFNTNNNYVGTAYDYWHKNDTSFYADVRTASAMQLDLLCSTSKAVGPI